MKFTYRDFWKKFWALVDSKSGELNIEKLTADWKRAHRNADPAIQCEVKIGGTTYLVASFFKQGGKSQSTALDKIQRLIDKDTTTAI